MKIIKKDLLIIQQIYPDAITIVKPIVPGMIHNVYIVECTKNKYVCRFSEKKVAKHNLLVSKILKTHNIEAPRVSLHNYGGRYCETYPFIPGKTLYERLQEGLSSDKLDCIYHQIFDISYKIENILCGEIPEIPMPVFSKFLRETVSFLNPSEKKLCHTDLNAKNIVLDKDDNVHAILDLDSVCHEYASVAHYIIMKDAKTYGYDINKLSALSKDVDVNSITMRLLSLLSETYIRLFPEDLRKQVLKVRIK